MERKYYSSAICKFCNKLIPTNELFDLYENEICQKCFSKQEIAQECAKCGEIEMVVRFYKDRKKYCYKCHPKHMGWGWLYDMDVFYSSKRLFHPKNNIIK